MIYCLFVNKSDPDPFYFIKEIHANIQWSLKCNDLLPFLQQIVFQWPQTVQVGAGSGSQSEILMDLDNWPWASEFVCLFTAQMNLYAAEHSQGYTCNIVFTDGKHGSSKNLKKLKVRKLLTHHYRPSCKVYICKMK